MADCWLGERLLARHGLLDFPRERTQVAGAEPTVLRLARLLAVVARAAELASNPDRGTEKSGI